jgi:hypothetical protein
MKMEEWVDQARKMKMKNRSRQGAEVVPDPEKKKKKRKKAIWTKKTSLGLDLLLHKTLILALGKVQQLLDIPQLVDDQPLDVQPLVDVQ